MRIHRVRAAVVTVAAAAVTLGLAACGDGDTTSSGSSSVAANSASNPSAGTSGGSDSSAAIDPNAPATTDPSATAVPGPRLPAATSIPPSKAAPSIEGTRCDTANGPEGALRVVIFPGGSVDCGTVMPVARAYGPTISTGRNRTVDGWSCGPSQTTGVLARCTRGESSFGFIPQ
ncbi:hypothetical protein ACQ7HM_07000 [Williamsia sp. MIQD14]|uniref:hypothetical protein n=1 Tax=Williamsia sp. MIQD14 TaxID=3425703 RepID=UPI003DA172A4